MPKNSARSVISSLFLVNLVNVVNLVDLVNLVILVQRFSTQTSLMA